MNFTDKVPALHGTEHANADDHEHGHDHHDEHGDHHDGHDHHDDHHHRLAPGPDSHAVHNAFLDLEKAHDEFANAYANKLVHSGPPNASAFPETRLSLLDDSHEWKRVMDAFQRLKALLDPERTSWVAQTRDKKRPIPSPRAQAQPRKAPQRGQEVIIVRE
jgi:hypothetical protein